MKNDEWMPIETAPKDGREILVWSFRDGSFVAFWHAKIGKWLWTSRDLGGDEATDATHWQYIPDEPSDG